VINITELWYEQPFGEWLRVRFGKMDPTRGFESDAVVFGFDNDDYANDEVEQFLNDALINNPSIPFPDNGIGLVVALAHDSGFFMAGGISDANADATRTGFDTAFSDDPLYFRAVEIGVGGSFLAPGYHGTYRMGAWNLPAEESRSLAQESGFYASIDQSLTKGEGSGVGVFFRYGASGVVYEYEYFLSAGFRASGVFKRSWGDVLAVGFARGSLRGEAPDALSESVVEAYYAAPLLGWLTATADVQYLVDPAGDGSVPDALVCGLRLQTDF